MLRGLVDLVFPPHCLVCRLPGGAPLCGRCRLDFKPIQPPICIRCGRPLERRVDAGTCGRCRSEAAPFAAARAMALFDGRLRIAIHRLKFEGRMQLGPILGDLLAGFVRGVPALADPDIVVPVPMHRTRQRARGYNHASLLAEPVAEALRAAFTEGALMRITATAPQTGLRRDERRANVSGAFGLPPAGADIVRDRSILLIDDVLTSGATVAECARVLLASGAAVVRVATLAMAGWDAGSG